MAATSGRTVDSNAMTYPGICGVMGYSIGVDYLLDSRYRKCSQLQK